MGFVHRVLWIIRALWIVCLKPSIFWEICTPTRKKKRWYHTFTSHSECRNFLFTFFLVFVIFFSPPANQSKSVRKTFKSWFMSSSVSGLSISARSLEGSGQHCSQCQFWHLTVDFHPQRYLLRNRNQELDERYLFTRMRHLASCKWTNKFYNIKK